MSTLLQIATYQVPANEWVALCCPVAGSCLKAWFEFDGDLHLRSDPSNSATDYLVQLVKGNEFDLPFVGPVSMSGRPICYAQAASGTVNVTVFGIMQ